MNVLLVSFKLSKIVVFYLLIHRCPRGNISKCLFGLQIHMFALLIALFSCVVFEACNFLTLNSVSA